MNEPKNHKHVALSDKDVARLSQLRETLGVTKVDYTLFAHDLTIRSAQEGTEQGFGGLASMAPTFILRSEIGYLAAVIRGDTRLSYKKIRRELKLRDVCLATPEQVRQVTGSEVGYVSLINTGVGTIVDSRLARMETVYGGCGVPYHTLRVSPRDLIVLTRAQVFDFTEPKDRS